MQHVPQEARTLGPTCAGGLGASSIKARVACGVRPKPKSKPSIDQDWICD